MLDTIDVPAGSPADPSSTGQFWPEEGLTKGDLLAAIRETGTFAEETEQALEAEVTTFKTKLFQGTGADGIQAGQEAEDDAAARAQESEQERIVKQRRG